MDFNLLQSVRDFFNPHAVDQTANQLGESSSNISKALTGVIPAVLGGLIHRSESGHTADLLNAANTNANSYSDMNIGSMLGNALSGSSAHNWLDTLFGTRVNSLSDSLASYGGVKNNTIQSLMRLVAPIALTLIGRHVRERNLTTEGLGSWLSGQKTSVRNALPSGLNIGQYFGFDNDDRTRNVHGTQPPTDVVEKKSNNLLIPILLGLAALALIYFLSRGCNNDATETAPATDTTSVMTPAPSVADTTTNRNVTVRLNDNTELQAYRGGIEESLVACLNDAACQAGKDKWFDFDNINFETGSARLTSESQQQVNNLAAILKAYPKAVVKIGGYTDNTGDAAANKKLSEERAVAVDAALKAAGVANKQLKNPEGYGSEFAKVAATASDAERRTDRRISVQLSEK